MHHRRFVQGGAGGATTQGPLEAVCTDWVGTPDPHPIRGYLNEQLRVEERPELENQLNAALVAALPRRVHRHAQEVALDYHDRPYYGQGEQDHELWVRGKAKAGTTRCYRGASASLVLNGLRVPLALCFVLPDDDPGKVLDTLLTRVKGQGLRLSGLLLDKGFEGIAGMEDWTRQGPPALSAGTIRGMRGGPRALGQGHTSYCTTHTFKGAPGIKFTAALIVCRVFPTARRTGRLPRRAEGRLFMEMGLALSPRSARPR